MNRPAVSSSPWWIAALAALCAAGAGGASSGCGATATTPGDTAAPGAADAAVAPTCNDGVKNGLESDTDCGGDCPHCATGHSCRKGDDCGTRVCMRDVCVDASCTDGAQNGSESDVDCGGACAPCPDGKACRAGADCVNMTCKAGQCIGPTCSDGLKNGGETDVDCGGPRCPGCALGLACAAGGDCDRSLCAGGRCSPALTCNALHAAVPKAPSGIATIDPDGPGPIPPIAALCDMTSDGGGFTLLFHHDVSAGYFAGTSDALSASEGDPMAKKYSILRYLKWFSVNSRFLLRIDWPGYAKRNIWSQSTDPTTDVNVGGYTPIDIQSMANLWGGLELGNGNHGPANGGAALIDGSVNNAWWYYGIGQTGPWGIPAGIPSADDVAPPGHGVAEVRLWVR